MSKAAQRCPPFFVENKLQLEPVPPKYDTQRRTDLFWLTSFCFLVRFFSLDVFFTAPAVVHYIPATTQQKKVAVEVWGLGVCHVYSFSFRGVQRLLWQQPKVMMTSSWEWTCLVEELHHCRPPNSCTNRTWHFGDKPRARTRHPRQVGRQDRRQEKDKTTEADTESGQMGQDRRQKNRQDHRGGHSIPAWRPARLRQDEDRLEDKDQMGDKLGDKTGDKTKTRPGRWTQHTSPDGGPDGRRSKTRQRQDGRPDGRQDRRPDKDKTREADTAS